MANIGEPRRTIEIIPLEEPATEPVEEPVTEPVPVKQPEEVPA
jgi:hypothetical protein